MSLNAAHDNCAFRWRWLGQVKQSDGGFRLCVAGEEDVRYDARDPSF